VKINGGKEELGHPGVLDGQSNKERGKKKILGARVRRGKGPCFRELTGRSMGLNEDIVLGGKGDYRVRILLNGEKLART